MPAASFHYAPAQQQQFVPVFLLPLLLPLFSSFVLFAWTPRAAAAQCDGGCCGSGCAGSIVFPAALLQNATNGGTEGESSSASNGSSSSGANLKELLVPRMIVDAKKNGGGASVANRRRRRSTTTDWGSEKMLTPQQLDAKFQQIRLLQQRPLSPIQPELPPVQPPDFPPLQPPEFPPLSVTTAADDVPPFFAYGNGEDEAAGKLRPQATSGLGQFIHVKPTVLGTTLGLVMDGEMEDPTLKHPFEQPFYR